MTDLQNLAISDEAANRCADACREFSNGIADLHKSISLAGHAGGFGTLPSGQALEKKYSELAVGGAGSLTAMLQAHITVATNLAATFTEIGKHYQATDDAVAQNVISTDPPR
ncbi:MAG: hypothetical protein WBA00_13285 [Rhodococcus sp. (in: high G+C Gram-positive bacteria)]